MCVRLLLYLWVYIRRVATSDNQKYYINVLSQVVLELILKFMITNSFQRPKKKKEFQ